MGSESLVGKTAIVTGGATGIGKAIGERLAGAGASIVIADIDTERGSRTVEAMRQEGGSAAFVQTDITDESEVTELFDVVVDRHDSLDVLVNNAGGSGGDDRLHRLSSETWDRIVRLNLSGAFLCAQQAIEPMIASDGGSMVHISSVNGVTGIGLPAYSAAKAGLHAVSRIIATQYGSHGIRSNVVCPATIDTASSRGRRDEWEDSVHTALVDQYPLGRFGTPEEVADAVLFLASEESSFVTGTELRVDGGFTAGVNQRLADELYGVSSTPRE